MFSIIELQTINNETTHIYQTALTREEAMSKYHTVLASAAISNVDYHACVVLNEEGVSIARESYNHFAEDVPETEA